MDLSQFETIEQKQKYLTLRWLRNLRVRMKLLGFRFSLVWEFERKARVNLKLSKFLYHGTQERRLKKILEDRTLKPNSETGEVNYLELSHKKSVYLTTSKGMSQKWAYWNCNKSDSVTNWSESVHFHITRKEKAFIIAIPKKLLAHRLKLDDNLPSDGESFRVEGPIRLTPECEILEVYEKELFPEFPIF